MLKYNVLNRANGRNYIFGTSEAIIILVYKLYELQWDVGYNY